MGYPITTNKQTIKNKNYSYNKFLNTGHLGDLEICQTYRNQIRKEHRNAYNQYYTNFLTASRNTIDIMWKSLNFVLKCTSMYCIIMNSLGFSLPMYLSHFVNIVKKKPHGGVTDYINFRNISFIFLDPVLVPEFISVFLQ